MEIFSCHNSIVAFAALFSTIENYTAQQHFRKSGCFRFAHP